MRKDGSELTDRDETIQYGLSVRELRLRRRLTLDQLAEQTGLSKGHLSRFERGEKSLSVAALMRVAFALGTSDSTLLGKNLDDEAFHLVRQGDRKTRATSKSDGDMTFAVLSRGGPDSGPSTFVFDIPARSRRINSADHAGEEILFVIDGGIDIEFRDRALSLSRGDYLQFPGHLPHTLIGQALNSQILVVVAAH